MLENKAPKYDGGQMTQEKEKFLSLSLDEVEAMETRDLRCPNCGHCIQTLYGDISGHLRFKCKKCKGEYTVNLKYFRRRKMPIYHDEYLKRRYNIG